MWLFDDAPYRSKRIRQAQLARFKIRFDVPENLSPQSERPREEQVALEEMVNRIYGELTIIDGKVGALTQGSSVLLFIASFALTPNSGFATASGPYKLIVFAFVALFIAVLLCLSVVFLYWFRFDVSAAKATDQELLSLLRIRNGRTRRYRGSWFMTIVGSFAIAASFLWIATESGLIAIEF
jgi:hypothetical protein